MKRNNRQLKNNYGVVSSKAKMSYQLNPPPAQDLWLTRVVSAKPASQPGHHKYTGRCAKPKGCVGYKEKGGKGVQKSRAFYVGGGLSFAGSSTTEALGRLCNEYDDDYWDDDDEEEPLMGYWDDDCGVGSSDVVRSIVCGVEDDEDQNVYPRDVVQSISQEFMSNWDKKSGFGGAPDRLDDDDDGVGFFANEVVRNSYEVEEVGENKGIGVEVEDHQVVEEESEEEEESDEEEGDDDDDDDDDNDDDDDDDDDDAMSFCDVGFVVEQVDGDEEWCMVEEM